MPLKKFMKNITGIFIGIIFFIFLVSSPVHAQVTSVPTELPILTTSATPSPTPIIIDYQLPYPGILPGSPLYSLKMIRDRIMDILISDPIKKANFYLLQADKRTASSLMLFEKGDDELADTTLSKSQKYLEKSLEKTKQAKNSGRDVGDIYARIKNSAMKQKQEIEILSGKSKEKRELLKDELNKAKSIEKNADQLKP